ncbi:unnamed protein product [Gongylonema pulchrum]|uniref:BAR_3_WASP_bdg domain-containing protein n=1 Tax=Gongylonema pulchrum TaxID=637853 RepID=A0A183DP94_9BILA|nr:unnamed protein product [Gongylonema pulchrum]
MGASNYILDLKAGNFSGFESGNPLTSLKSVHGHGKPFDNCMVSNISKISTALSKLHENERLAIEGRLSNADMEILKAKIDSISYVMLAEMAFQGNERGNDFKNMMAAFLEKQAAFYNNIGRQLASLAVLYRRA